MAITSRWTTLAAGIYLQFICGVSSTFSILSPSFVKKLNFNQKSLTTLYFSLDIGASFGLLGAVLCYAIMKAQLKSRGSGGCIRFGTYIFYLIGACLTFLGYFVTWLFLTNGLKWHPKWATHIVLFLAGLAQSYAEVANIIINVQNFPDNRGAVIGIIQAFNGLSDLILLHINISLFDGDEDYYLLCLAILPPAVTLIAVWFIRVRPASSANNTCLLNLFWISGFLIASFMFVMTLLDTNLQLPPWVKIFNIVLLIIFLTFPLGTAVYAHRQDGDESDDSQNVEDMSWMASFRSTNFWILCVSSGLTVGSAKAIINNLSQIGESLSFSKKEIQQITSLWSVFVFFGCYFGGILSDTLLGKFSFGRPWIMAFSQAVMLVGHMICRTGHLYYGTSIIGACYGSLLGLIATITVDLFGVGGAAGIFSNINIANALASFIMTYMIDRDFSSHKGDKDRGRGAGFHDSFLAFGLLSLGGCFISLVLGYRTRALYQ